jgi:hypothetical protein
MTELDPLIDAALESYPLTPLPRRFVRRTMAVIRPRFRLEFLDLALPGFFILFAATLAGVAFWLVNALNPVWLLEIQIRAGWYAQNLNALPLGWFAAVGLAGFSATILAGVILALALDRPAYQPPAITVR